MKVATYNVNSLRKRIDILHPWLRRHKPDVHLSSRNQSSRPGFSA